MKFSLLTYPLCMCCSLGLLGCNRGGLNTVPVSGRITFDGTPLSSGSVTLIRQDVERGGGIPSVGSIGEDGTYVIGTGTSEGAPLGQYKVVVTSTVPSDPQDPYSIPKSLIPDRYTRPESTDLRIEVVATPVERAYDLELSSKQ